MKIDSYSALVLAILIGVTLVGCSGKANTPTGEVTLSNEESADSTFKLQSPIKTCRMVEVPYEEQEAYIDQEPYQATEEYQENLKYEVVRHKPDTTLHGFDVWATGDIDVRNVDSETGTFTVEQSFRTLAGTRSYSSSQYIMPGETKNFHQEHDIDRDDKFELSYSVIPGQKTLTRQVTRFRDVTKYRTVTKTRQEEQCN
jgi:hypothetical protein